MTRRRRVQTWHARLQGWRATRAWRRAKRGDVGLAEIVGLWGIWRRLRREDAVLRRPPVVIVCPKCGSDDCMVMSAIRRAAGYGVRRKRECLNCGTRFKTIEQE